MAIPIWNMTQTAAPGEFWFAARRHAMGSWSGAKGRMQQAEIGHGIQVVFADLGTAEAAQGEWDELLDRALEPNVFLEPAFALGAARHFAEARRPTFVLLRAGQTSATPGRLVGIWPLEPHRAALTPGFVATWRGEHAALGIPLIDRFHAAEAIDAMFGAIAGLYGPQTLLSVSQMPKTGATYGLMVSRALATNRRWSTLSHHSRAVLRAGMAHGETPVGLAGRHAKEARRQRRRLEELGTVEFHSARSATELRAATERFLALEHDGWKGRHATALLSDAGSAAFLRSTIRTMGSSGRCRIDELTLDNCTIAAAIVLEQPGRAYFWKTTFDERFAAYSPGVQLTRELTDRQLADPSISITDSCAIANHPMIDRHWPERQEMIDLAVAGATGTFAWADRALQRERVRRQARDWAKAAARRLRLRPGRRSILPSGRPRTN